jgi:hypothetical protein
MSYQPGSLGIEPEIKSLNDGTMIRALSPTPGALGTNPPLQKSKLYIDNNTRILAAVTYGEGSVQNIFEEMAAIANVLVRQQIARGYSSISAFIKADKTFAFAAHDGNARYKQFMAASADTIEKDIGMSAALQAANNGLSVSSIDYANGAFFWDGADIKSNYDHHAKVRGGIHFTDSKHNIYDIKDKDMPGEVWWKDAKGNKTKLRGKWDYKYESTAAYGGTIFWKYNEKFLKASANKEFD